MLNLLKSFYSKYRDGIEVFLYLVSLMITNSIFTHVKHSELIIIPIVLLYLYSYYFTWRKQKKELKAQGLTFTDARNAAFLEKWQARRKNGAIVFYLSDGGVFNGTLIFIPLSGITFYKIGMETLLAGFGNLLMITAGLLIISFLIGSGINYFRWQINDRRFERLSLTIRP